MSSTGKNGTAAATEQLGSISLSESEERKVESENNEDGENLANGPALGVIPLDTAGSGPKPIRERHVAAAQQRGRDVDPKAELPTLREVSLVSTRIRRNIEEERASNRVLILTGTGSRVLHSTAARN